MTSSDSASAVGFLSHDGKSQIRGLVWQPVRSAGSRDAFPRGIVQIVHGMSEYVGRYDDFARFLAGRGFVVCGTDHIGHGKSVAALEELGHMPSRGSKDVLVEDVHQLRLTVAARYSRQTPYILFGHSMGSFIVRSYLTRYGEGVSAAVLSGTGQPPFLMSKAGNLMARRIAAFKGDDYRSTFLDGLGAGAFAKKIPDARTPFDWISADPQVVDSYVADEQCGTMFSAGAYATLTELTAEVVSRRRASKIPHDLPLLFVSGADDPVGDYGKGVHEAAELMRRAGVERVDEIIYPGMRHEILNEPGRMQVYTDVSHWIEEHACRATS